MIITVCLLYEHLIFSHLNERISCIGTAEWRNTGKEWSSLHLFLHSAVSTINVYYKTIYSPAPSWLASSIHLVRALHLYCRGQGSNPGKPEFCQVFSFFTTPLVVLLTVRIFFAFISYLNFTYIFKIQVHFQHESIKEFCTFWTITTKERRVKLELGVNSVWCYVPSHNKIKVQWFINALQLNKSTMQLENDILHADVASHTTFLLVSQFLSCLMLSWAGNWFLAPSLKVTLKKTLATSVGFVSKLDSKLSKKDA